MTKVINIGQVGKEAAVQRAVEVLSQSGVVIYPTETCYGVGVDATNKKAVDKLYGFKGMRRKKPVSIAVSDARMASKYVRINRSAYFFYKHFLPGPYTVISEYKGGVDERLVAVNKTLGVRVPDYELVSMIVKRLSKPITATSANPTGYKTPYSVKDDILTIDEKYLRYVDLILDAGVLPRRPPSVVVDTTKEEIKVLRGDQWPFLPVFKEKFLSRSPEETVGYGVRLVDIIGQDKKPKVMLLSGVLGAGKTHLVKGIGQGLGVSEVMKSPSFVLMKEYEIKGVKLIHVDLWRLKTAEEVESLGLDKYIRKGNWVVIEWAERNIEFISRWLNKASGWVIELEVVREKEREIRTYKISSKLKVKSPKL